MFLRKMLQQKYFKRRLIDMKQVRRSVKQILFSLTLVMVFFINIHPVMAQEISNESKNAIWNEFEEKRENGLEVYELLDDNGNFMGYYEPYSETNPEPVKTARYTANINWEIPAGKYSYGENQYTLSSGSKIQVSISQSQTGTSYLTFQNRTSNSSLRFTNTKVTNGWKGTVVLGNISSAVYSFGIENASSVTITYTGSYSL
jgi:hypothetical protein